MFNIFWKQAMRSRGPFIFFLLITWLQILGGEMCASGQEIKPLKPDDVLIGPNCMRVPLGSILLVRKEQQYCAIKFTKFWTGETKDDEYATYESYYQNDTTGNFNSKNVQFKKGELAFPSLRGIGHYSFSFGKKLDIKCGPIKLLWSGKGWVYFFNSDQDEGDYGIELSPSKWTDIPEVNVFDQRLHWYKYDSARERKTIPIDRLW